MPIDNDPSFWKWLVSSIVSGGLAVFSYHKWIDSKIAKKADRQEMTEAITAVRGELARLRDNDAKLFDQARESEQRAQDRHERLMSELRR